MGPKLPGRRQFQPTELRGPSRCAPAILSCIYVENIMGTGAPNKSVISTTILFIHFTLLFTFTVSLPF
jgi:hypothetical protein